MIGGLEGQLITGLHVKTGHLINPPQDTQIISMTIT